MPLKADLHIHTREGEAFIAYDARSLIDRAAAADYQVLAITNHDMLTDSDALRAYAWRRGILLIPGVEVTLEGVHVLLYRLGVPLDSLKSFDDLRRHRQSVGLVVAPHPFFPGSMSLQQRLREHLYLFDAIEFCHFYTRTIDFNRPAVQLAHKVGLPLVGTSDSHLFRQLETTYSLIDAEPTVDSVFAAIRAGRVQVVSRPLTVPECVGIGGQLFLGPSWARVKALAQPVLGFSPRATAPLPRAEG